MNDALEQLLQKARTIRMSTEQEQEQRVSFVYGNTNIENDRITRSLVEEVDAALNSTRNGDDRR